MPTLKRIKTNYPGVYFIKGKSIAHVGKSERIYYIRYRKDGKEVEEKAGRQFQDNMTAIKAVNIRTECIEGIRLSRKELRDRKNAEKKLQRSLKAEKKNCAGEDNAEASRRMKTSKESEGAFQTFVETASDLMCMMDKDNRFIYVNDSMAKTLGYSKKEMIGMNISKVIPKGDLDRSFKRNFEELISRGTFAVETVWVTKDGKEVIYGEIKGLAVFDQKGKYTGGRAVLRDISKRKRAEQSLIKREMELDIKNKSLEEMNAALRVLLKQREEDKAELEKKVLLNIQEIVMPYLEKLNKSGLNVRQESFVEILESNLNDIVSPFAFRLSSLHLKLTPAEILISDLVKQGKTTKEIAELLHLSEKTIESQRRNIRKKLGIKNKKENLRTYLMHVHNV